MGHSAESLRGGEGQPAADWYEPQDKLARDAQACWDEPPVPILKIAHLMPKQPLVRDERYGDFALTQ